jgi:alpha/beta superfamily hydrolase
LPLVRCSTLLAGALAASLAGCGSAKQEVKAPTAKRTPTATPTGTPGPIPPAGKGGPAGARAVGFRADDGVGLRGRLFGKGAAAVVLVHMGNQSSNEADWFGLARRLAREGYLVLAYNRRGVCSGDGAYDCSAGEDDFAKTWQDVGGAVDYVTAHGARGYAVIGSSIGASSALYAAKTGRIKSAAYVSLAGVNYQAAFSFSRADLQKAGGAKLFVSGDKDPFDAVRTVREWYGWAKAPKQQLVLPSIFHGTDMLAPTHPTSAPLTRSIVRFLRTTLPPD